MLLPIVQDTKKIDKWLREKYTYYMNPGGMKEAKKPKGK